MMQSHSEGAQKWNLELSKLIRSTPEAAYQTLTDPVQVSQWFTTQAQADLSPGGRYSNADGNQGEFLVLEASKRVMFTLDNPAHCPGTQVEVAFMPTGVGEVEARLVHLLLKTEKDVEDMRTGWGWALASFKSYLEKGKPVPYEQWLKKQG